MKIKRADPLSIECTFYRVYYEAIMEPVTSEALKENDMPNISNHKVIEYRNIYIPNDEKALTSLNLYWNKNK